MALGDFTEKEFIDKLTQITLEHLEDERFGGRELALALGMSWSTLNRRVQAINGKHISQIIREIRLEKALELLQDNHATAAEVAFKVGFGSPAYFSKCFNQCFGFPPGEVKKRMAEGTLPLPGERPPDQSLCPKEKGIFLWCSSFPKPYLVAGFGGLALLVLAVALFLFLRKDDRVASRAIHEKSIAVLPFKNLSSDSNNQYFADGISEEIINQLFRIGDLRVVSRTTADRFRDSDLSTTDMAKAMGVNYILEGSVRKQGDRLRITVQLIDGIEDHHLWSDYYDREAADIFLIQSEIAQNIARELQAVITPAERSLIEKPPTKTLEAYNYYLIGNNYYWRGYDQQDFTIAISMYSKAIELDPDFALAYTRLAISHANMYWFHYDYRPDRVIKCREAIDAATSIDPDLPEIHLALGYYHYWCLLDYSKGLEEFEQAAKRLRNNPEIFLMKGAISRRTGDWEHSLENFLQACELDPGSPQMAFNTAETYFLLGAYPEAEAFFNKTQALNPTYIYGYWMKSLMYLKWKGNTAQARKTMAEALKFREAANDPGVIETKARLDIYDGHPQEAISFLKSSEMDVIQSQFYLLPKSGLIAQAYQLMGATDSARFYYDSARVDLEARLIEDPEDSRLHSALGRVYAGLGMKEKAIASGLKGVELMPLEKEAYRGAYRLEDLARIYVMTGEYPRAIPLLDRLLSRPGVLSAQLLLLDPSWKPLWDRPEFKAMIKKYEGQGRGGLTT